MNEIVDKIKSMILDKRLFLITFVIFLLMITLVDKNNLMEGARLRREITSLELQRNYYMEQISLDSAVIEGLKNDTYLEKLARERYLMKRSDETIYVIKE